MKGSLDLTTASGRLLFQLLAAMAESFTITLGIATQKHSAR